MSNMNFIKIIVISAIQRISNGSKWYPKVSVYLDFATLAKQGA